MKVTSVVGFLMKFLRNPIEIAVLKILIYRQKKENIYNLKI